MSITEESARRNKLEVTRLRGALATSPNDRDTLLALARHLCAEIQSGDDYCLDELRTLVAAHEDVIGLVPFLARALYSSMFYADLYDGNEELAAKRLDELRHVLASFSDDPEVRDAFAMALMYVYGGSDAAGKQTLRSELSMLAARFPNDAELQYWLTQFF